MEGKRKARDVNDPLALDVALKTQPSTHPLLKPHLRATRPLILGLGHRALLPPVYVVRQIGQKSLLLTEPSQLRLIPRSLHQRRQGLQARLALAVPLPRGFEAQHAPELSLRPIGVLVDALAVRLLAIGVGCIVGLDVANASEKEGLALRPFLRATDVVLAKLLDVALKGVVVVGLQVNGETRRLMRLVLPAAATDESGVRLG